MAIRKCSISYRNNRIGDYRILTANKQLVGFRFDDGITVVAAVIHRVAMFDDHCCQALTCCKSCLYDVCHRRRNGDVGETCVGKSVISDAFDSIGNCNVCEIRAASKCSISNACHAVWNGDAVKF